MKNKRIYSCDCFYCKGYTKDMFLDLKEKIVNREIPQGIEEYRNRFTDYLQVEEEISKIKY